MLQIGDQAPDFKLFSSEKAEVSLSDYKGKNLVVLFFPHAFTSVCTKELCDIRDGLASFASLNAEVVAISVDTPYVLAKFKEEQHYNFPLLSDFNKEASTAYHSIYEQFGMGMRGVSKRSAFVIDGEGVIKYAEVLENAGEVPNMAAIKATLEAVHQTA